MATATNNLDNYFELFADGVDPVPAYGPHKILQVEGTWAAGDTIELLVIYNEVQYDLGLKDITQAVVTYAIAFRDQVMICAGDRVYYSGLDEPTGWEDRFAGYGYLTTSGERGEALEAVALAPYAGKLAIFARNNIQLWIPSKNPEDWQLAQSLENIGTCSPRSVVSYGELDVFFLADSGVRSLRAREFTDLVNVQDVGSHIDVLFQALLKNMSESAKALAIGFYSSKDGRYQLMLGGTTYVFSYFPGTRVAAWTQYTQEYWNYIASLSQTFFPLWTASRNGSLFILDPGAAGSGDARTLGVYPVGAELSATLAAAITDLNLQLQAGTITQAEYSAAVNAASTSDQYVTGAHSTVTIIIPFFDAKAPATRKYFKAIDIYGEGTWDVYVGDSVLNPNTFSTVPHITGLVLPTAEYARIPLGLHSSHIQLKLVNTLNETAAIAAVVWHWDAEDAR